MRRCALLAERKKKNKQISAKFYFSHLTTMMLLLPCISVTRTALIRLVFLRAFLGRVMLLILLW